jgi:hypothetical protein
MEADMIWRSLRGMLVVLTVATSVPAWAQTRGTPNSGRDIKIGTKQAPSARKSCPEYGPGFVRLKGASTCVRVGGGISMDGGIGR